MTTPLSTSRPTAAPPAADVEQAVRRLIEHVGEDPDRDGLRDTPGRVARSLLELTQGYGQDPAAILATTFEEPTEEMVVLRRVPFWSLCEHHMLPFQGHATVAYLPGERIVGLSKLARLVHCFAQRLQVQERLTREVADALDEHLRPRGVAVVVEAEHTCMHMRGARSEGTMRTSALLGEMRDEPQRREFFDAAAGR